MAANLRRRVTHERNGGVNFLDKKDEISRARIHQLRQRAEQLRTELVEQIDGQLNELIDDVLHDVDHLEPTTDPSNHPTRDKLNGSRVFVPRQSLLTELLEVNHIKTIYNIFVALLIVLIINTVVYDYIDKGSLTLDLSILRWAFGKPSTVVSIWLVMKVMAMSAFPIFMAWHSNRHSWMPLPDMAWFMLYITYLIVFAIFPVQEVCQHNLPPASSIIILAEQVRFMLKVHAFVRENVPKVLSHKKEVVSTRVEDSDQVNQGNGDEDTTTSETQDKEANQLLPEFGQYLYFLFCPTLVYRDQYPMTPYIRWNYVVSNAFQTLACIFNTYYVFARFCVPVFRDIGKSNWSFKHFTLCVFNCMLPGTVVLVLGFFAILHSWLNAFAEMTRFADRMFYKDWWNSNSYADYYRTWNVVVHDWLYAYIYKDLYRIIKNRQVATVSVFILSAIVHEYVLLFAFRFFYPILLIMFGAFGLSFVFLKPKKHENVSQAWNIFMWITLIVGNGLLMCMYSMEWFANQNCPRKGDSWLDLLSPRSWSIECVGMGLDGRRLKI
ncbi:sterol O-acyltransferase 1-like [Porites lutea]|uniref:sterol O-acyltransferase 1-like n=1 Tax=Porites lutea TaxID=51062 RepID=UPI003CC5F08E